MERDDGMMPDIIFFGRLFLVMVVNLLVFSIFLPAGHALADEGEAHFRVWNFDQEMVGALPQQFCAWHYSGWSNCREVESHRYE